ncbi:MAG: response regulator transcription factor [Myxococcota bacterium]
MHADTETDIAESESDDTPRLLIVEDEQHLAAGLKLNFEMERYTVDIAQTAREAARLLGQPGRYAAVILDVTLPDSDGFTLCRKMRSSGDYTPVLMLTARTLAEDRVSGLESGADDYLTKPFELDELLARVRSMLRRQAWERQHTDIGDQYSFGDAEIDFERHEVRVRSEPVTLTNLELELLRYFAQNPEKVLSRAELLEKVWKLRNYPNTRTVDNFVMRLRRHFEDDPSKPAYFHSIRGAGYKFVPDGE